MLLLVLACATAMPLSGQESNRWAVLLRGGFSGSLRGELFLPAVAGRAGGTIWLESESSPSAISDVVLRGDSMVEFRTPLAYARHVQALIHGDVMSGVATSDSGLTRRLQGARLSPAAEFYPVLPQFTLRQLTVGRADSVTRIPGRWLGAARARKATERQRYAALAKAAGLRAYDDDAIGRSAPGRSGGSLERREMAEAVRRTLTAMEAQIADARVRAHFNRAFRPRGTWLVDLRDAAQLYASAASPVLRPSAAIPALRGIGWLGATADTSDDAVMEQLFRVRGLLVSDTIFAATLPDALRRVDPQSSLAVQTYLGAFAAAESWYASSLEFLLTAPWIAGEGEATIAGRISAGWPGAPVTTPAIRSRYFGYPQAVPRYGLAASVLEQILIRKNWSSERWVERHGWHDVLESLRLMPLDFGTAATVERNGETLTLTTVRRQSEARDNGFLEPTDAIEVDPGYVPLLALGAAIHEWQHLLFEAARPKALGTGAVRRISGADPFMAEGVAEWQTARILDALADRFPLLAMGEAEKRVRIALTSENEPHVLGLALLRALAEVLPAADVVPAAVDVAADPTLITGARPQVVAAWDAWRTMPDLSIVTAGRRQLVPEITFTIEDGYPDLTHLRILDEAP